MLSQPQPCVVWVLARTCVQNIVWDLKRQANRSELAERSPNDGTASSKGCAGGQQVCCSGRGLLVEKDSPKGNLNFLATSTQFVLHGIAFARHDRSECIYSFIEWHYWWCDDIRAWQRKRKQQIWEWVSIPYCSTKLAIRRTYRW